MGMRHGRNDSRDYGKTGKEGVREEVMEIGSERLGIDEVRK